MSQIKRMKGIMMTGWCVRALLDGRKGTTMRIIRPQPIKGVGDIWILRDECSTLSCGTAGLLDFAPYQPGDKVYVKEALRKVDCCGVYCATYAADKRWVPTSECPGCKYLPWRWKNKSLGKMFMPREAARIFRVIKKVDVKRPQELTTDEYCEEGCVAEMGWQGCDFAHEVKETFKRLWNDIQKDPADQWAADPPCWYITFEQVEGE